MSFDQGVDRLRPEPGALVQRVSSDDDDSEDERPPTFQYRRWDEAEVEEIKLDEGQHPKDDLVQVDVDQDGEPIWGPNPSLLCEDDRDDDPDFTPDDSGGEHSEIETDTSEEEHDREIRSRSDEEDPVDKKRQRREPGPPVPYLHQLMHLHMSQPYKKVDKDEPREFEDILHELETVKKAREQHEPVKIERERFIDRGESRSRTVRVGGKVLERKTGGRPGAPEPENGFVCSTAKNGQESDDSDGEGEQSKVRRARNDGRHDVDKGHILALQNGGPDIPENIVPQWAHWQESGIWRRHETHALKLSDEVRKKNKQHGLHMKVRPHYKGEAKSIATFGSKTFPSYFSIELIEIDAQGKEVKGGVKEIHWLYAHQNGSDDKKVLRRAEGLGILPDEGDEGDSGAESDDEREKVTTSKSKNTKKSKKATPKREHPFEQVSIPGVGDWILNDVPGDGDCAFHSALGASGDGRTVEQLRSDTAYRMEQNHRNLPRSYIQRVRQRGVWSTNLELEQMARVLGVTMHVHTLGNDGAHLQTLVFGNGSKVIHLANTGYNHFQILRDPNTPRYEVPVPEDILEDDKLD